MLLCVGVYLPGLGAVEPVDRDECRFAQASRQMLESQTLPKERQDPVMHGGGLAIPMYGNALRLNKPPLTYWLQSVSVAVLSGGHPESDAIWMYRIPSVLAATCSVLALWRIGIRLFDPRVGLLGAAMLAVGPMVIWDAHQARSDQLLLLSVTITQLALWRVLRPGAGQAAAAWYWPALFWAGLTAGVLAKGPVAPMIVGLTLGWYIWGTRDWAGVSRLRWISGLSCLIMLVGAWAAMVIRQIGMGEALRTLNSEFFVRATLGSQEGHFAPPGTHLVLSAVLLWPGSLLTLWAVIRAFRLGLPRKRHSQSPEPGTESIGRRIFDRGRGRFGEFACLAWLVPSFVAFELSSAKLPHYTMPLYPAAALLSARGVFAAAALLCRGERSALNRAGLAVWMVIGMVPLGCFGAAVLLLGSGGISASQTLALGLVSALSVAITVASIRAVWSGDVIKGQYLSLAAAVVGMAGLMHFFAPAVAPGQGTARLMAAVEAVENHTTRPIASLYHEDSLVFATRGRVARIDAVALASWLDTHPDGIVIVPEALRPDLFVKGLVAGEPVNVNLPAPLGKPRRFVVAASLQQAPGAKDVRHDR